MEALGRGIRRAVLGAAVVMTTVGTAFAQEAPPPPDVVASPATLDFGTVAPGSTSQPQTITWTNQSSTEVTLAPARVPPNFAITEDTCADAALAPQGACTTTLVFRPENGKGSRGSVSRLVSTGTAVRARVTGRVPAPPRPPRTGSPRGVTRLVATPLKLAFGIVRYKRSSKPLHVTITNTGTRTSTDLAPRIVGANSGDFRISSTTCRRNRLEANEACVVAVVANPKGRRDRRATLVVANGGPEVTLAVFGLRSKPRRKPTPKPPPPQRTPVDATPAS